MLDFGAGRDGARAIGGLQVFGGTSARNLTKRICEYLKIKPGEATVESFPDGETLIKLEDDVRGRDCFIVQSTCPPVNDNLMELLIFIDCLRRASANRITAVIPYYGYARQDRKSEGRTPITAKLVANMIVEAGAHRVLTMDLHATQIQGFFDIPLDHLTAAPVISDYFANKGLKNTVLVSPDVGNVKTATEYASRLHGELAVVDKRRIDGESAMAVNIIGEVRGKTVLIFDDMITTAGTVTEAIKLLRKHGANDIYVSATHAVFAPPAVERLKSCDLAQITVTDTIEVPDSIRQELPQLNVLSVSELMGEAIKRIHNHESISALFQD
jgi:ribose-phosphate pyrophosphokinase